MPRLRSDFWVAAHLRRLSGQTIAAVQRRRGAAEAGAIFLKIDRLDGTADLYGPAPQSLARDTDDGERRFVRLLASEPAYAVEERITREMRFDTDLWIIEVDDREGRHGLDLAE